jgi:hypothetical protein
MEHAMRFAIVGLKRTGSSYLVNLLGGHPQIHCCGEIFNPDGVNLRWPKEAGGRRAARELESELEALRATDPVTFLERVYATDFGRPVVGFKIFKNHHPEMLTHILADRNIAKIVHSRANGLARYASALAKRLAGPAGRHAEKPPVAFDAAQFAPFHREHATFFDETEQRLAASGQDFHRSRYEELNNPARLIDMLNFLGVAPELPPLQGPPPNRGSSDVLSRFSNPEAAEAYLRDHGLMQWAHEG